MNTKFKTILGIVLFPFMWALMGTILAKLMVLLGGTNQDPALNIVAGAAGLVIVILCYWQIFTTEE